jgi:hypothetical protein
MLPVKKAQVITFPARAYEKQLETLYARRSSIDALIESLQEYDRFREKRGIERKRRSA